MRVVWQHTSALTGKAGTRIRTQAKTMEHVEDGFVPHRLRELGNTHLTRFFNDSGERHLTVVTGIMEHLRSDSYASWGGINQSVQAELTAL